MEPIPGHTSYPAPATYRSCTGTLITPGPCKTTYTPTIVEACVWKVCTCSASSHWLWVQNAFTNEEFNCLGHFETCVGSRARISWDLGSHMGLSSLNEITLLWYYSHMPSCSYGFLANGLHETVFTLSILSGVHTTTVQDFVDATLCGCWTGLGIPVRSVLWSHMGHVMGHSSQQTCGAINGPVWGLHDYPRAFYRPKLYDGRVWKFCMSNFQPWAPKIFVNLCNSRAITNRVSGFCPSGI